MDGLAGGEFVGFPERLGAAHIEEVGILMDVDDPWPALEQTKFVSEVQVDRSRSYLRALEGVDLDSSRVDLGENRIVREDHRRCLTPLRGR